jgi:hypothetical protein
VLCNSRPRTTALKETEISTDCWLLHRFLFAGCIRFSLTRRESEISLVICCAGMLRWCLHSVLCFVVVMPRRSRGCTFRATSWHPDDMSVNIRRSSCCVQWCAFSTRNAWCFGSFIFVWNESISFCLALFNDRHRSYRIGTPAIALFVASPCIFIVDSILIMIR